MPIYTSYVGGTTTLNGGVVTDLAGPTSPLVGGMAIDGTTVGNGATGTLAAGATATVEFQVTVD